MTPSRFGSMFHSPARAGEALGPLDVLECARAVAGDAVFQDRRGHPGRVQPRGDLRALLVEAEVAIAAAGANDHRGRGRVRLRRGEHNTDTSGRLTSVIRRT